MTAPILGNIKSVCSDSNNNLFIHHYPANCYYSRGNELKEYLSNSKNDEKIDLSSVIVLKTLSFILTATDIEQISNNHKLKLPKHKQIHFNSPSCILGSEGLFEIISIPPKYFNMGFQKGDWCIPADNDMFGTWSTFTTVKNIKSILKIKSVNVSNSLETTIVSSNLDIYLCSFLSINSLSAYVLLNNFVKDWNDDLDQDYVIINLPNSQMGKLLLQLANYKGIKSIVVLADKYMINGEDLCSSLLSFGATYVISESKCKSKNFLQIELPKILGRHGQVKLALDAISGESTFHLANTLSENGIIITYGTASSETSQISAEKLMFDNCQHLGFWLSKEIKQNPDLKVDVLKKIVPLFEKGILKMPKDTVQEIIWDHRQQDDIIFLRELTTSIQSKNKVLVRVKH
ncbi:hypothetical protein QEN19_003951 [Hanseniaspora menglaensis]